MATSSLIKVKIQRNVPAKGGEGSTAGSSAETNGSVDDKKESSDVGQQNEKRKDKMAKKTSRFEPYNPQKRYRAFISNIPFDVKWQSLKDLVKEKVGEVTYVELLMDDEGKSRGCASVEFKLEDSMKKAVQILNKHVLSGRPLKVKEDLHGERLRRAAQSIVAQGSLGMGMPGPLGIPGPLNMSGPGPLGMGPVPSGVNMNIPANIMNNPNIPVEVIHALQSGRLGSTVFVANLDYTVGWKKLKEVFGISGTVVRADILEDKDGKSRGIGTVTYEQAIEAVQAISMFNGQPLFDRPMMVKIDDKSMPKGDHFPADRPPQLPRGLGGIGMGLGPGGQPLDTNHLRGSSGLDGPPIGGNGNLGNLSRFGSGMGLGRLSADIDRGLPTGFDRSELSSLSRSYSDSLDRGLGSAVSSLGSTIERLSSAMGRGAIDRVGSNIDRMGLIMDCMGPSSDRIGSGMGSSIGSLGIDISSNFERMVASGLDRINTGLGYGADRMGSGMDRTNASIDRMGSSLDRVGSGMDRVGVGIERLGSSSLGPGLDHVGTVMDRLPPVDCLNSFGRVGLDCIGSSSLDRMGTSLGIGSNLGLSMATNFDRQYDIEHNKYGSNFGGAGGTRSGALLRKGCQIFVRNLSFDCTWKMLKDKFNECGYVVYADIKMENGKSKGCGVVKFESPEVAERACRMMNGIKLGGREIDVRMDRNA